MTLISRSKLGGHCSSADLLWLSFQLIDFMHSVEQKTSVDFLLSLDFMTVSTTDWIEIRGYFLTADRLQADCSKKDPSSIDEIVDAYGPVDTSMRAVFYLGYVTCIVFNTKLDSDCLVRILTNFAVEDEVGSSFINARQAEFLLSGNGIAPLLCELLLSMISPNPEERPKLSFVYEQCCSELMPSSFSQFLHPYFSILPLHFKKSNGQMSLPNRRILSLGKLVEDFEDLKHVLSGIDDESTKPLLLERAMTALIFGCTDFKLAIKALNLLLDLRIYWSSIDFCCCILPRMMVVYQHSPLNLCLAILTAVQSCTSLINGELLPTAMSLIHSVVVQEERKMLFSQGMSIIFSVLEENSSVRYMLRCY